MKQKGIDWDKQPLGKEPDTVIAKRLGVNSSTVRIARIGRGIEPCTGKKLKHKGIDWDNQPLGEISDADLGRQLGVAPSAVQNARKVRKIPALDLTIDWDSVDDLGQKEDKEIARRLGVSKSAVALARKQRNISSWKVRNTISLSADEFWCCSCQSAKHIRETSVGSLRSKSGSCAGCMTKAKRKRYKNDPQFATLCKLRSRMRSAFLVYSKNGKQKSSSKYGISWKAVCEYLGLSPGHQYQIDHVVPLAFFDLEDDEQVRLAFVPENHCWIQEGENSKKKDLLPNGESGRDYRDIPLEQKIHIYNEILFQPKQ